MDQKQLTTLSTPELLERVQRLAAEDPAGQSDDRWEVVRVLHAQAEPLVYQRAAEWCASNQRLERMLGADILAQLGATTKVVASPRRPFASQSAPILEGLLADCDPNVVSSALFALGHLSREDSAKIAALAAHPSADVREAVAVVLGGRDELPALQALVLLAADDDEDVRNWATFGLGTQCEADSPEIRAVPVARLSDANPETSVL
ncbi:MAG TPA: HEAT repeat domain-containing protein [Myxococcota bacterium]|nr:HEAT repeat domain-containing protein [Myxococcota bacterium]